jgi:hypothetical protein
LNDQQSQHPTHPLKLSDTDRLLSSLKLARHSPVEIEHLADRLALARSLREINQVIRPLRQQHEPAFASEIPL